MDEKLYRKLGQLTKEKTVWKQNIPYIASLLENQSPKITAKAMWLLGEMGLMYPQEIAPYTKSIAYSRKPAGNEKTIILREGERI